MSFTSASASIRGSVQLPVFVLIWSAGVGWYAGGQAAPVADGRYDRAQWHPLAAVPRVVDPVAMNRNLKIALEQSSDVMNGRWHPSEAAPAAEDAAALAQATTTSATPPMPTQRASSRPDRAAVAVAALFVAREPVSAVANLPTPATGIQSDAQTDAQTDGVRDIAVASGDGQNSGFAAPAVAPKRNHAAAVPRDPSRDPPPVPGRAEQSDFQMRRAAEVSSSDLAAQAATVSEALDVESRADDPRPNATRSNFETGAIAGADQEHGPSHGASSMLMPPSDGRSVPLARYGARTGPPLGQHTRLKSAARTLMASGQVEDAARAYTLLLEGLDTLGRDDREYLGTMAVAALASGRLREAGVTYRHLLQRDPENSRWWAGLAIVEEYLGRGAASRQAYGHVARLSELDSPLGRFARQRAAGPDAYEPVSPRVAPVPPDLG